MPTTDASVDTTTFVYFIESRLQDNKRAYKIGHSRDPWRRLRRLQTANPAPLRMIAAVEATPEQEEMIHAALADNHIRGEWFDLTPTKILQTLNGLTTGAVLATPTPPAGPGLTNEVGEWVDACCERRGAWTRDYLAYSHYQDWCRDRGVVSLSHRSFRRRLKALGIKSRKIEGQRVWQVQIFDVEEVA